MVNMMGHVICLQVKESHVLFSDSNKETKSTESMLNGDRWEYKTTESMLIDF